MKTLQGAGMQLLNVARHQGIMVLLDVAGKMAPAALDAALDAVLNPLQNPPGLAFVVALSGAVGSPALTRDSRAAAVTRPCRPNGPTVPSL